MRSTWRFLLAVMAAQTSRTLGTSGDRDVFQSPEHWWWAKVLGSATPVEVDFSVVERHVCSRRERCVAPCVWDASRAPKLKSFVHAKSESAYFSERCRDGGEAATALASIVELGKEKIWDGLGDVRQLLCGARSERDLVPSRRSRSVSSNSWKAAADGFTATSTRTCRSWRCI